MRQLLLMRHAEAEPLREPLPDAQRALTAHGREQALESAQQLRRLGLAVDALLVSPAARALQTAMILAAELDIGECVRRVPALYGAEPGDLLRAVQQHAPHARSVLLIAHNPAVSTLVRAFDARHGGRPLQPSGLCCVDFDDEDWRLVSPAGVRRFALLR